MNTSAVEQLAMESNLIINEVKNESSHGKSITHTKIKEISIFL